MKSWLAINLRDFHKPEKKWMSGDETKVEATVVGGKNLDQAKITAQIGNNDPWILVPLNSTKNIVYAKL